MTSQGDGKRQGDRFVTRCWALLRKDELVQMLSFELKYDGRPIFIVRSLYKFRGNTYIIRCN